ncbi:efflux RND transporter periplasmic adaptor subunit [Rhodoferax sp. PAMC 29310]|uniref:efflux RND transporter periplasmic adaptor subunit n=1 Tax=Rhodoferax sp. PAMC 29310 TaxID=2822760 RepID=UPI001B33D238|nr:efflux RND transporter periplasmic adaptor subunit [Rhodoferax sp. PAMC 29310]
MNKLPLLSVTVCCLAVAALLSTSVGAQNAPATPASPVAAGGGSSSGAPVSVTTVKAKKIDMPLLLRATGTVTPLTSVDVRAQVSSLVSRVHIKEGQFVKAGELLFTLDARTDEANVGKVRAQLAKDNVALADARRQFARSQQLFSQNFISQGALDASQTVVESQLAAVAASQASVSASQVALSYARIVAPHAGRVGAINVFPGSAVQANVTPLVTVTQLDPVAVAYSIPQRNLSDALAALKEGGSPVTATLADGAGTFEGRLKFVDSVVDASSGAVKAKAVFANSDHKLWPGAFVEVSQTVGVIKDAVVVPQAAIVQNARGTLVYAMVDGKAESMPVKVLYSQGADAAVEGIKPGSVLVLDGKQNVRPGSTLVERTKDGGNGGRDKGEKGEKGDKSPGADKGDKGEKGDKTEKTDKTAADAGAEPKRKSAP